jgi:hypothetical protein
MLKNRGAAWALAAVLLLACYATWLSFSSKPTEAPAKQERADQPKTKSAEDSQEKGFWDRTTSDPVSLFTLVLAVSTGVLGAVAIIQIRYLANADRTALITANAAKAAAEAASQQATVMVDIELPILMIVDVEVAGRGEAIKITIGNYGRTPAIIAADCLDFRLAKALPPKPRYTFDSIFPVWRDKVVERRETFWFGRKLSLDEAEWEAVRIGEAILWVFGYIDYLDFRKTGWREGFCIAFLRSSPSEEMQNLNWVRSGPPDYTYKRKKREDDN